MHCVYSNDKLRIFKIFKPFFLFVWGVVGVGEEWKEERRQSKARAIASLLYLTSHRQENWLINQRLMILLNSVNTLPEDLPWTGYCTDMGRSVRCTYFSDLNETNEINLKFSFCTSSIFCTLSRVFYYSVWFLLSARRLCVSLETRIWERMNEENLGQRLSNFLDFASYTAPQTTRNT